MESAVLLESGAVVFPSGGNLRIELSSCDTHEKILSWVAHLLEKSWVTKEIVHRFIDVAIIENNIKLAIL